MGDFGTGLFSWVLAPALGASLAIPAVALGFALAPSAVVIAGCATDRSPAGAPIQATGMPGSPGATTTISGEHLPPPPAKLGELIEKRAENSIPSWPPGGPAHVVRTEWASPCGTKVP